MKLTERDEARFWSKVALPNREGCMLWMGYIRPNGYGQFGRNTSAHRASYVIAYGPIPDGLQVDHVKDRGCTNRHCVAPDHLEAVTQQENIHRGNAGLHQKLKTHCPSGHEYTEANTRPGSHGQRMCLACARPQWRAAAARWRQKQAS